MSESKVPSSVRALIAEMREYSAEGTLGTHSVRTRIGRWADGLEAALSPLLEEPEQESWTADDPRCVDPYNHRGKPPHRCSVVPLAASVERAEGRQEQEDTLAIIVRDLRALPTAWANTDVDDRNALTAKWRAALSRSLGAPPTPVCDCIASGNTEKPKQHGADPHAKTCAIYRV